MGTRIRVTEVRIRRVEPPDQILKAYASITLNRVFAIHKLKVIEGEHGLFVSMPARRAGNGGFADVVHPVNPIARAEIERSVIEAYHRGDDPEPLAVEGQLPRPPEPRADCVAHAPWDEGVSRRGAAA